MVCGLVMINVLAIAEAGAFLAAAAFGASLANVVLLSVLTVYSVASGNEQKLMTYVSLLSTALMGLCVTYGAYGEVTVSGDKGSKTISTEDVSKSSTGKNTYYHVTTREAADKIIESGKLTKSKWETRVFAWSELPSKEQDADIVMFLYRDDYYNKESEKKDIAEVILAKHRGGSTGTVELLWLGSYTKFVNLERRYDD